MQSRAFSEMLKKALNAYHNRAIATQEVIEELIRLAKEMRDAVQRGADLGLNDDEIAFYDALAMNESAIQAMGIAELKVIAAELVTAVRKSVTIDWTVRESARAKIRVMVRRILKKHGYANGVVVETGDAPKAGGKFFCERGQLNIDRNNFNIMPGELKRELLHGIDVTETSEESHMRNFLDCVRTRRRPNADVEIGQRSVTVAHLANIARWTGGRLEWDPVAERFTNSDKVNGHLCRKRRKGFELPAV